MMRKTLLMLFLLGVPTLAAAQPIVNPSTVEFTVQPIDHTNTVSYVLELNAVPPGATPMSSLDIGKPTPTANVISYAQLATLYAAAPQCPSAAAGCYTVTVIARNTFGDGRTGASVPFTIGKAPTAPGLPVIKK